MRHHRRIFLLSAALVCLSVNGFAQYDDIYFNPKTDIKRVSVTTTTTTTTTTTSTSAVPAAVLTADNISLTEEDYTYSNRIRRIRGENLLVHIDGGDTTIYDLEDGSYLVSLDGDNVDISAYDASRTQSATNIYVNYDYGWGWNDYYWYRPYYYGWGWYSYYDAWYWDYYSWYRPWYYYHPYGHCHHYDYAWYHQHHHHHYYDDHSHGHGGRTDVGRNYFASSNENYRLQHNAAGRYGGTRTNVGTTGSSRSAAQASGNTGRQQVRADGTVRSSDVRMPAQSVQQGSRQMVRVSSAEGTRVSNGTTVNRGTSGSTVRQSSGTDAGRASGTRVSNGTSAGSRQSVSSGSSTRSSYSTNSSSSSSGRSNSSSYSSGSRSSSTSSSSTRSSGSYSSGSRGSSSSSGSRYGGSTGGTRSGGSSSGSTRTSGGGRR